MAGGFESQIQCCYSRFGANLTTAPESGLTGLLSHPASIPRAKKHGSQRKMLCAAVHVVAFFPVLFFLLARFRRALTMKP